MFLPVAIGSFGPIGGRHPQVHCNIRGLIKFGRVSRIGEGESMRILLIHPEFNFPKIWIDFSLKY